MALWSSLGFGSGGINIKKAADHLDDVEERPEKRARTLKRLLQANHVNYSVIYNKLRFVNHNPHVFCSAYVLGADAQTLKHIYNVQKAQLDPWEESPGDVTKDNWREHLGKREYQRAYLDFFEDQLAKEYKWDWRALLNAYLLTGDKPLINALLCGLSHPLIHLGYAEELSSRTIAVESLALTACFYGELNLYLDDPKYTRPARDPADLFTVIDRVHRDATFHKLPYVKDVENVQKVLEDPEMAAAAIEHWNSWQVHKDPTTQFAESQKFAVAVLAAASTPLDDKAYDFFIVHILTASHGVRVLLPILPAKYHVLLVRQWWLFSLMVYIAQQRPKINLKEIEEYDLKGRDWRYVVDMAVRGKYRTNAHYVKAIRSIQLASTTWGDPSSFYLKAAVKVSDEFDNWGGFGPRDPDLEAKGEGKRTSRRHSGAGEEIELLP